MHAEMPVQNIEVRPRPIPGGAALFIVASLLTFSPVLIGEYVADSVVLMERLQQPPGTTLADIFSPAGYGPKTAHMSWRPLTAMVMLLVDVRLFHATPFFSHALNLLLHGVNAFLLFLLLRRVFKPTGEMLPAVAGAVLFLVHPLVSEAAVCSGFRADVLAATGVLGCAHLFMAWEACRATSRRRCSASLLAAAGVFGLGLLAKEIAVVALAYVPLLMLGALPKRTHKLGDLTVGLLPLLVVFFVFVFFWSLFRYQAYPTTFLGGKGRVLGTANALVALSEVYLARVLWPWPLRLNHAFVPVDSLGDLRVLAAAAAVLLFLLVSIVALRRERLCGIGALWFLVGFVPVAQIVPVPIPVAERFCYVPMLGIALLVAGVFRLLQSSAVASPRTLAWAGLLVAVVLAGVSFRRSLDWRDNFTLNIANWEDARDRSPQALEALAGLYIGKAERASSHGNKLSAASDMSRARDYLNELLRQDENHAAGHYLYTVWALSVGDRAEARKHGERALSLTPQDPAVQDAARAAGILPEGPSNAKGR